MDFNSIMQAAAKTMENLSEFVFISMGDLTLARPDAYLTHVKSGIKPDTVSALRTAPLHIPTLFPDAVIKRAEEEVSHYESKGQALLVARHTFTLIRGRIGDQINNRTRKGTSQHGRTLGSVCTGNLEAKLHITLHDQPRPAVI